MSKVNEQGILLSNNAYLQAKNSGGVATNLIKVNASGLPEFASEVVAPDPTSATHVATKNYTDTTFIPLSQKAAALGVATLDASGKLLTSQLPSTAIGALNYKGTLDASAGSYPSSPAKGDYYVISVAGTISSHAYSVGDWAAYDGSGWDYIDNSQKVSSVNGLTGVVVLTTTNIAEGTNLYYTTARAQADAVVNSLAGSQTNQAPSVASVNTALGLKAASFTSAYEEYTLASGDITNGYKDLAHTAQSANSVEIFAFGGVLQSNVSDVTISLAGGSGGVTRITFAGDLLGLVAGNKIVARYRY